VIVEAEPGAAVHVGFAEPVELEAVRGWMRAQDGAAMLAAMRERPVAPGDAIFVPAGTPHAIGARILLVELQEPTDLSILLEWDGFELTEDEGHLELGWDVALQALDRSAWDDERLAGLWGPPDGARVLPDAADPYFRAERVRGGDVLDPGFAVLVALAGAGTLETAAGAVPLARGVRRPRPPRRGRGHRHRGRAGPALPAARPGGRGRPLVSRALLLGLDVGTTAVKAAVFDEAGAEVADGRAVTPGAPSRPGPSSIPTSCSTPCSRRPRPRSRARPTARSPGSALPAWPRPASSSTRAGVPSCPRSHGTTHAAPRRRASWAPRSARTRSRAGPALTVSPLCSLVKLRWMRAHWPAAARGVRWLNVAEWIVRALGGDERAEASLSSRTGFYELETRRPWAEALEWAQAPAGLVDAHAAAGTPLGRAGASAPRRARGAVLSVGGHDHLAAAVGADAAGEGDVLDSCGTAEAWVRACAPLPAELAGPRRGGRHLGRLACGRGPTRAARLDPRRRRCCAASSTCSA
jgi:hypothetical protein